MAFASVMPRVVCRGTSTPAMNPVAPVVMTVALASTCGTWRISHASGPAVEAGLGTGGAQTYNTYSH